MQPHLALESTLLLHGVPLGESLELTKSLFAIVKEEGAVPRLVTVQNGLPCTNTSLEDLKVLLSLPAEQVPKLNSSNLGAALHLGWSGATTISSTMELAAKEGVSFFATGGLGGVHPMNINARALTWDVSSDLGAFTRFPVAVVASGVKSILDVASTRETLEALGVPVVGYQTSDFPAFYFRKDPSGHKLAVDVRFDDLASLARFVKAELLRTGRGLVIANPIAAEAELTAREWEGWLSEAEKLPEVAQSSGRERTPKLLGALHRISQGKTLAANIRLIKDNVRLGAALAREASL
jgi:pseudouridine-5'-phosphate glycosidase